MNTKLVILLSALALAGCGAGSGEGLDNNGQPEGTQTTPTPAPTQEPADPVTLTEIQSQIFDNPCAGCHTGAGAPVGLRLDSEDFSFNNLVGVTAGQKQLPRVDPGNPDNSYLVHKIEGGPDIVNDQMPKGGTPLSQDKIDMIRDWITNGAPRTGTGLAPTSVSKTTVQSTATSVIFQLHFSRAVQAGTLTSDAVQVYLQTENGERLASADEYSIHFEQQELTVAVNNTVMDATAFTVVVNDPSLSAVLDIDGRIIDGDKDQIDGGAYRYVYPL